MAEPITITITGAAGLGAGGIIVYILQRLLNGKGNGKVNGKVNGKCSLHDGIELKIDKLVDRVDNHVGDLHKKSNEMAVSLARIEGALGTTKKQQ